MLILTVFGVYGAPSGASAAGGTAREGAFQSFTLFFLAFDSLCRRFRAVTT
jgi:hypothetical protein